MLRPLFLLQVLACQAQLVHNPVQRDPEADRSYSTVLAIRESEWTESLVFKVCHLSTSLHL